MTCTIEDVRAELAAIRRQLNDPKLTLFRARRLYRRQGELLRLEAQLEGPDDRRRVEDDSETAYAFTPGATPGPATPRGIATNETTTT